MKKEVGVLMVIIGIIWLVGLTIYLAVTDLEFAKHHDTLYGLWMVISHWGWIPIIMEVVGVYLWWTDE